MAFTCGALRPTEPASSRPHRITGDQDTSRRVQGGLRSTLLVKACARAHWLGQIFVWGSYTSQ
jgi:hypothetical protein